MNVVTGLCDLLQTDLKFGLPISASQKLGLYDVIQWYLFGYCLELTVRSQIGQEIYNLPRMAFHPQGHSK